MRFAASVAAEAMGGRLLGPSVDFSGASIDSRTIEPGQLFVPIVADRDGHDFVDAALAAGAAAYLTSREYRGGTGIVVEDTIRALGALGALARSSLPDDVIGITGSVGKTTTKDMLAAVLRRSRYVTASDRSFNNELGVPLTLVNAAPATESVIVEMGARGVGHIHDLCTIARPTMGIVTMIALAHAELFGDIETIAVAKGELVEALPADGTAILNADDPLVAAMGDRTDAEVVTFGTRGDLGVRVLGVDHGLRARVLFESSWGIIDTVLGARGVHQVTNAAAAAAGGLVAGASITDVAEGLAAESPSAWRMELVEGRVGAVILNDAYNANRTSTEAALRALAELEQPRKTAVLGLMAELGEAAPAEHAAVAALAAELGVRLIAVGTDLYGTPPVGGVDGVLKALGHIDGRDAVLVKGSRVNELERVAQRLATLDVTDL